MNIDLNGNDWRVGATGAVRDIRAVVPGCIHKDLLRAGRTPDPQVRDTEKLVQLIGETDWTYEREFEVPAGLLDHEHVELVCDGRDTLATIRLNGADLACTDNMHRRYRFEVASCLVAGRNRMEITFASPLCAVRERQTRFALPHWPGDCITPGFSWLRKAHCNFGWDWAPKLATCGQMPATVPALSSRPVQRVDIGEFRQREGEENLLLWLDLTSQGRTVSESVVTLVPPKHLNLLDPQLRVETSAARCRLTVQCPALWIWADAPVGTSWDDNFFHLWPGVKKEIVLPVPISPIWHSLKDL